MACSGRIETKRNIYFWVSWPVLAISKAGFCSAFVLHQHPTTHANQPFAYRPQARCTLSGNPRVLQLHHPLQPRPLRRRTSPPVLPTCKTCRISCLFGEVRSAGSGDGGGGNRKPHVPVGEEDVLAETQRLMTVPTIDIKLELQMRGVEHRDSFEKVDLARRLAEARVSLSSAEKAQSSSTGSQTTSSPPKSGSESASGQGVQGVEAEADEGDVLYARDVSRAMRMGKQAVMRELNAMGIAHSRLSDVSALAREYARGQREARGYAEDARRFRTERELDERLEATRILALSRAELESRLRASGVQFSEGATDAFLAALIVGKSGAGSGGDDVRDDGQVAGASFVEEAEQEGGEERAHGERDNGSAWGPWGRTTSWLPWHVGKYQNEEEDDEEEEMEVERINGAARVPWSTGDETATRLDDEKNNVPADWSVRGGTASRGASRGEDVGNGGKKSGTANGRNKRTSLQARADCMTSRELMKALDDLGAHYRIPARRSELQRLFVSTVLAQENGLAGSRGNDTRAGMAGANGDGRGNEEMVSLSPYVTEDEAPAGEYKEMRFETYHSALRWARQLTFDDVLDELRYREVQCNPKAGYSYLTRLLADEVLADEELNEAENTEGAHNAEVERAMAMSAQEIICDLRAGGERADVTLSKETLAEKLAVMNLRNRGELLTGTDGRPTFEASTQPRPADNEHSGSSSAYRRRRPEGRGRGRRASGWESGFAFPSSGLGAEIGDLLRFGDNEEEHGRDDALRDLEEATRTVGGAAWLAAQETAAFLAGTAAGLFVPEAVPEEEGTDESVTKGAKVQRGHAGRASDARATGERRARAVREGAGGVRRAAASFAQSSANRAGLAVTRSAANGVLRGAEAAADWAGGGALAREHVLLFVSVFCLFFKRGVGASVALLVVIRAGRITMQRLVSEGWAAERTRGRGRGNRPRVPGASTSSTDASPKRRNSSTVSSSAGRRTTAKAGEARRRPKTSRASGSTKVNSKAASGSKRAAEASKTRGRRRRKPLWDESDDELGSSRRCIVM